MSDQLADGWYKLTRAGAPEEYHEVIGERVDYGDGATVKECVSWGWQFEPAVVLTVAEHDKLQAEIVRLSALVAEQDGWEDASPTDHDIWLIDDLPDDLRLQRRRKIQE